MNRPIPDFLLVATLALVGCSKPGSEALESPPRGDARSAAVDTQAIKEPCEWLTREEVANILGPLAGEPYRALSAESVRANDSGDACAYPVPSRFGVSDVALQVDMEGAPELEGSEAVMAGVVAREMSVDGEGDAPLASTRTAEWDAKGWYAGERLHRTGHLAIRIGDRDSAAKEEALDRMAALLRSKIADQPFADTGGRTRIMESSEDACALLSRAEAEAVLGPLAIAPYRSSEDSALARADGPACTYYGAGHHALVVSPRYSRGKELFEMTAGLGSLVRSGLGGADAGDLLEGPWDSATGGPKGNVLFLSGDTALSIQYWTSTTDIEGAAKLAAVVMPRAVEIGGT